MNPVDDYPPVFDRAKVGTYDGLAKAGGGFVWDEVLEYRVWCHPDGDDYFRAFTSYAEAKAFSDDTEIAEQPLALVLQREHINEPNPGEYEHVKTERITEWPVAFLRRPRRTVHTIPDFFAPDAPANRLEILRGNAPSPRR